MSNRDVIEFYRDGHQRYLASVSSSMVLTKGQHINIAGVTWEVSEVTFALDRSQDYFNNRNMRCNVDLIPLTPEEVDIQEPPL